MPLGNVWGEQECVYAYDCISIHKNLDKLGIRECRAMSERETGVFYTRLTNYHLKKKILSLTPEVTGKNKLETWGMQLTLEQ